MINSSAKQLGAAQKINNFNPAPAVNERDDNDTATPFISRLFVNSCLQLDEWGKLTNRGRRMRLRQQGSGESREFNEYIAYMYDCAENILHIVPCNIFTNRMEHSVCLTVCLTQKVNSILLSSR